MLSVVTGASRGIGRAVVTELLAAGHTVIGTARTSAPVENQNENYQEVLGDLTSPDTVNRIRNKVTEQVEEGDASTSAKDEQRKKRKKRLRLLVHCCGQLQPIQRCSDVVDKENMDRTRRAFDVNYFSAVQLTAYVRGPSVPVTGALLPFLTDRGATTVSSSSGTTASPVVPNGQQHSETEQESGGMVIFMNSAASTFFVTRGWAAYCSSKAALLQFAKVLALENSRSDEVKLKLRGVLSLAPGICDTEMIRKQILGGEEGGNIGAMSAEMVAFFREQQENGKLRDPKEIGALVRKVAEWGRLPEDEQANEKVKKIFSGELAEYDEVEGALGLNSAH